MKIKEIEILGKEKVSEIAKKNNISYDIETGDIEGFATDMKSFFEELERETFKIKFKKVIKNGI